MAQRLGGHHGSRRTRCGRRLEATDPRNESGGRKGADKSRSHSGNPTVMIATAALLVAAALPSAQPGPNFSAPFKVAASGADIGAPAFGVAP
jgi:hypothetical protein